MKILIPLIFITLLGSCTQTSEKETEAIIKDLSRATKIIAAKNKRNQLKVERLYNSDTTDVEFKTLKNKFTSLKNYEEKFICSIKNDSIENACAVFTLEALTLLDAESQKEIKENLTDSPIYDTTLISQWNSKPLLKTELALEAEIMIEQVSTILLKCYNRKKPGFDWEIYWE